MTLSYPLPRETRQTAILDGNGSTGPYGPTAFKVFDVLDVKVWRKDADDDAFVDVTATSTIEKTADLAWDTVSVTLATSAPDTSDIVIQGSRTAERSASVLRGASLDGDQLEKELTKIAVALSELRRDQDNSWLADFGGTAGRIVIGAAGTVAIFDADGNLVEGPSGEDIAGAQTAAATATTKAAEAVAAAAAAAASAAEADGDVTGPAGSIDNNFVAFDGTTGKVQKDSGASAATFATAAQGSKADSALQPAAAAAAFQAIDAQLSSLVRQNLQNADYTLGATDSGKHIYRSTADSTARAWTIPANGSVPFPVGTIITFDNDGASGAVTIAITSDTLSLVGLGRLTGSRTLAVGGQATAVKVDTTRWRISGTGLT